MHHFKFFFNKMSKSSLLDFHHLKSYAKPLSQKKKMLLVKPNKWVTFRFLYLDFITAVWEKNMMFGFSNELKQPKARKKRKRKRKAQTTSYKWNKSQPRKITSFFFFFEKDDRLQVVCVLILEYVEGGNTILINIFLRSQLI